jgi:hypothetical protein
MCHAAGEDQDRSGDRCDIAASNGERDECPNDQQCGQQRDSRLSRPERPVNPKIINPRARKE